MIYKILKRTVTISILPVTKSLKPLKVNLVLAVVLEREYLVELFTRVSYYAFGIPREPNTP